jgi:hypothetical protein
MNLKLPNAIRIVLLLSAVMQCIFGMSLLLDPGRIASLWPWALPPLSARILGASTLVSIPLAIFSIGVNRFGVAAIPIVMMITYRVLQLAAGIIHFDRFKPGSITTINYFGGGFLLLGIMAWALWAGWRGTLPAASERSPLAAPEPWQPPPGVRPALVGLAVVYALIGLTFLALGAAARPMWIDAAGLTPINARLFASPLTGLGLGMYLCSRARDWRAVAVPATGMITIGFCGTLSLVLDRATFAPMSIVGWAVAFTPLVLLFVGGALLILRPPRPAAA